MGEESATTLFRVFQELLTNIGRHADASRVDVRLICYERVLRLIVSDDGRGMPLDAADSPHSLGIVGMKERVRHLGGTFSVKIGPGPVTGRPWDCSGTTVAVDIPIEGCGESLGGTRC